jgi:hypothetical protein
VLSSPAVANGVVYIGSDDNNVHALNAKTGTKLWSYITSGYVSSSSAVANGVVYLGSYDGKVYAFGLKSHPSPVEGYMGHSKAQKTRTHKRIVSIASKRFREKGLAGFGIAELMKEAGLTVGGFYKHFDSRNDLVAEAVSSAFGGWKRRVDAAKAGGPSVSVAKLPKTP